MRQLTERTPLHHILKSSILVSMMMLSFKIFGFFKQMVVARYYGVSSGMDLYSLASSFVKDPAAIVSEALIVALVSQYSSAAIQKSRREANQLLSGIFMLALPFFTLLAMGVIVFSMPIASAISSGRYGESMVWELKRDICLIAPYIIFSAAVAICNTVLETEKNFFLPRLESFINSGIIILLVPLFAKRGGILVLIAADLVAVCLFFIIVSRYIRKIYTFERVEPLKNREVVNTLSLMLPLLLGNASYRINTMVDSFLASNISGGPAALGYSHVLEQMITVVLGTSIGNIMFSYLAGYVAEKKYPLIEKVVSNILRASSLVIVPVTIAAWLEIGHIVELVYYRGNFDSGAVKLTAAALSGYVVGFPFMLSKNLLTKCIYAYGNTRIPTLCGIASMLGNVALSIYLSGRWGLFGITFSTSAMSLVSVIVLLWYVNKKYVFVISKANAIFLIKIIAAGAFAAFLTPRLRIESPSIFLQLLESSVCVFILYFAGLFVLKVDEMSWALKKILEKKGNVWKSQ